MLFILGNAAGLAYLGNLAYQFYDALLAENLCGREVAVESLSPDGRRKAVIYQFDCGATSPFTTQVSVLAPEEDVPLATGNLFAAYQGSLEGDWLGPYAEVRWLANDVLEIAYVADATVILKVPALDGVSVRYRELFAEGAEPAEAPGGGELD